MAQNEIPPDLIAPGAMVESTNGFVGIVIGTAADPQTGKLLNIVVQNESESKQFTLSAALISEVIGSRIIHLNVAREDLDDAAEGTAIDTDTGNFGHPTPPSPK